MTLYISVDISEIIVLSPSGINTERTIGEINYTLRCSAGIRSPLLSNVSLPTFEWFYGPNNSTLPSGVTVSNKSNNGNISSSILQFPSLSQNHTGIYTCRLGGNQRLAATINITVNGKTKIQSNKAVAYY